MKEKTLVVSFLLLLSACGSPVTNPSTPAPTQESIVPMAGDWAGDSPFVFIRISDNHQIEGFTLRIPVTGGTCTIRTKGTTRINQDGSFSLSSPGSRIDGQFTDPTSAKGTYKITSCEGWFGSINKEGNWTARKRG